jgi:hypothetical protein
MACIIVWMTSCADIPDELEIVARHIQTRPRMQIEDVYKLPEALRTLTH